MKQLKHNVRETEYKAPVVYNIKFRSDSGNLDIPREGGGSSPSEKAMAWAKYVLGRNQGNERAGHAISEKFGGTGKLKNEPRFAEFSGTANYLNIVGMTAQLNKWYSDTMESVFLSLVEQRHCIVCVNITFTYGDRDYPGLATGFRGSFKYLDKNTNNWESESFSRSQ